MTKNREGQMTMEPLLRAVNLTKHFGGLVAVDGVSFDVYPGEVIGLVGDNGAGKSTFIKMISGYTNRMAVNLFRWEEGQFRRPSGRPRHGD